VASTKGVSRYHCRAHPKGIAWPGLWRRNWETAIWTVSIAFMHACRACGIHDFRFHDLRHTAASWLRMQGADIHTYG
jgi:integrase